MASKIHENIIGAPKMYFFEGYQIVHFSLLRF